MRLRPHSAPQGAGTRAQAVWLADVAARGRPDEWHWRAGALHFAALGSKGSRAGGSGKPQAAQSPGTSVNHVEPPNGEQIHLVNYVEDYLDSIESLPFDLQRNVSLMQEIDAKYQEIL